MTGSYRGLTWDHPRGTVALRAAVDEPAAPVVDLIWDAQPLEGFESASVAENAAAYDLLVLDHPHLGEALRTEALRPLDELFTAAEVEGWRARAVGPSFASYELDGRAWALPLDAATQVSALADPGIEAPTTWAEALELASDVDTVLPLTGPHLFLTLCSIAVGEGVEPGAGPTFLPEPAVADAMAVLERFVPGAHATETHNPITVLEDMARQGGPVYCPHVYGYVTYSRPAIGRRPVRFVDAPAGTSGRRGSVLGGTGIAVSRRCEPDAALLDHLRWLMDDRTQRTFIPRRDGQPSVVAAWEDDEVDAAALGFYSRTRRTVEDAWVRPRHDGAIAFQSAAADRVRAALLGHSDPARLSRELDELHHRHRPDPAIQERP
ncbi:carbohydrate ABC transporter substrate-binding protein [Nocardioides hwasunensis]|uniref:Carbohydrate ABC transporter substrate-binding protein n=1 Tax=Nocardioides hwasunensis TaxID=397258 RepID=A0ABR8MLC1_9ACTN|nr:carbohydrate ABC transporter substrate-binding protein [Nocardioides hwasunensis]MBD3915577.1 carbohydrate ABC transporter substrate-binding protein [Nocardioides hwasunensis]